MKIAIMMEGETEQAFMPFLRQYLRLKIGGAMPKIISVRSRGRIPKETLLKKEVNRLLRFVDNVVALTDVYTGSDDFSDAAAAKRKMREWVGENERFFPHAAQYEFEAWLLPYWAEMQKLAGSNRKAPGGAPESVNHNRPPSCHIKDIFRTGKKGKIYSKEIVARRIFEKLDLSIAAAACPELKAFLNTLLLLSGGELIE